MGSTKDIGKALGHEQLMKLARSAIAQHYPALSEGQVDRLLPHIVVEVGEIPEQAARAIAAEQGFDAVAVPLILTYPDDLLAAELEVAGATHSGAAL